MSDTIQASASEPKGLTEAEIQKDRNERIEGCRKALQAVLEKFQYGLVAEDFLTPNTKVNVQIQFVDLKQYDAQIAQPEKVVSPIAVKPIEPPALPVGVQADGGVVINKDDLK